MPGTIEIHPFEPFLPEGARVLLLGSFPPQQKRWSMDFYYPNFINDFWRICGLIFYGDREHFIMEGLKKFDKELIISFCTDKGIAMYDTACAVRRLQDNASDKFLEVVTPTDIPALLQRLPRCRALAVTGQKAADTLCGTFGCPQPKVGGHTLISIAGRPLELYRLPSTSRAYPLPLSRKAEAYQRMFRDTGLIDPPA